MTWLSPAYPVGGFSYSHGLEWAVESGEVGNGPALQAWVADLLRHGGPWSDAVLFAQAWRAADAGDAAGLAETAELASAFAPSRERRLETTQQGEAFRAVTQTAWPCAALAMLRDAWDGPLAYPVAVGVACAGHGIPLRPALGAFVQAFAAALVSAAVRLIPLGQTEAQRITAALMPAVAAAAAEAAAAPIDALGGAALRSDLAAMRHETQTTRLFRS